MKNIDLFTGEILHTKDIKSMKIFFEANENFTVLIVGS